MGFTLPAHWTFFQRLPETKSTTRMRYLLVDDHPLFREVVSQYLATLDADARVFEAGDGAEALAVLGQHQPFDMILLDIAMPGQSGQTLLARIQQGMPDTRVVFVSSSDCPATVEQLMEQGASGFISKATSPSEFTAALRLLLGGERYISPAVLARLNQADAIDVADDDPAVALTPRQLEVLPLLYRGLPNKAIARELACSEGTVKLHVSGILRALRVSNRTEAVAAALRHALLDPSVTDAG